VSCGDEESDDSVGDEVGEGTPAPVGAVTRGSTAATSGVCADPPPAAASAIAMPEPEMAAASRRRNAARRRGSSRRWDLIIRPAPSAEKTTVSADAHASAKGSSPSECPMESSRSG